MGHTQSFIMDPKINKKNKIRHYNNLVRFCYNPRWQSITTEIEQFLFRSFLFPKDVDDIILRLLYRNITILGVKND